MGGGYSADRPEPAEPKPKPDVVAVPTQPAILEPEVTVKRKPVKKPKPKPEVTRSTPRNSVWDKIAQCESGGNWHINTGNGYYGGLQFSARTWKGIGGPGLPHQHSRETQIHYAEKLQARYGWGQWSCAHARFD